MAYDIDKRSRHSILHAWGCLSTSSLDALAGNLSAVEAGEGDGGRLGGLLDGLVNGREDDLDVARVTLVRVDATVRTVCAAAGFLNVAKGGGRGRWNSCVSGFESGI